MTANPALAGADDVVSFWREAGRERWFEKSDAFDEEIRKRFLPTHEAAAAGGLSHWAEDAQGALALLLLLDQFPRNMFRNSPRAFATDSMARRIAERALVQGHDRAVVPQLRSFFYLPFMHSEHLPDQERCVAFFRETGDADGLNYALIHEDIIRRFGRFPHRNAVLGRTTTPQEQAFLDGGGFAG